MHVLGDLKLCGMVTVLLGINLSDQVQVSCTVVSNTNVEYFFILWCVLTCTILISMYYFVDFPELVSD